jgi:Domain of unknown function (DUF1844)
MSETPKSDASNFEFVDRRKLKAQEEQAAAPEQEAPPAPQPKPGPRLVVEESRAKAQPEKTAASAEQPVQQSLDAALDAAEEGPEPELPPAPSVQESKEQKAAYDASAQRIEEMARAQNPTMGAQPPLGFEHLIQQFYLSALIQMGAGTHEGQRPQVDILGARSTIDLLGILAEKTRGNLTPTEDRMLQSILYELRMMFLEITGMISMPNVPQPPPAKR